MGGGISKAKRLPKSRGLDENHPGSDITFDESQFAAACNAYGRRYGVKFLSCREILHVAKLLGYRLVAKPRRPRPYGGPEIVDIRAANL
jgi:hypothetical protein